MTTNELRVLEIIWDWGGEASVDIIAREAGISIDYARLLCESLGREDCIDFLYSKLCKIKSKGKLGVAEKRGQNPRKIVIPERPSRFGYGKPRRNVSDILRGRDKRGRFILNYG